MAVKWTTGATACCWRTVTTGLRDSVRGLLETEFNAVFMVADELQTSQPYPSKNNKRDKLITNADGSVDLYLGPEAPAGKEAS